MAPGGSAWATDQPTASTGPWATPGGQIGALGEGRLNPDLAAAWNTSLNQISGNWNFCGNLIYPFLSAGR
jgi:hypothetical protein